jgi:hypothetical protein
VAVIFCVPIALAIRALGNLSFVLCGKETVQDKVKELTAVNLMESDGDSNLY